MRVFKSCVLLMALGFGVSVMAEKNSFVCVHEKDLLPALDPVAESWYREAVRLAKPDTLRPWYHIVELYEKAIERNHWKAMHNLAALYRTGWPGGVEKDTQRTIELYQRMINLNIPQGFYNMGSMIGNRAGISNPATEGLTFLDKAARMGNPSALTQLGKLYIYVGGKEELGLQYTRCAAEQGYGQASYELGMYHESVTKNFPKSLINYQIALSRGSIDAAFYMASVFDKKTPPHMALWYTPEESLSRLYSDLYQQLLTDPDLRFPALMKDHPLPPHPTQGYDADRPEWKPDH